MATYNIENGYVTYAIESEEIVIENIKVFSQQKGTGRELLGFVKNIAREANLPISLYAFPQDDSISQEDLVAFYFACGFDFAPDDSDGKLLIWN